jgi:hypothetical protein
MLPKELKPPEDMWNISGDSTPLQWGSLLSLCYAIHYYIVFSCHSPTTLFLNVPSMTDQYVRQCIKHVKQIIFIVFFVNTLFPSDVVAVYWHTYGTTEEILGILKTAKKKKKRDCIWIALKNTTYITVVLGKLIIYFPLIWNRPYRKLCLQQFFIAAGMSLLNCYLAIIGAYNLPRLCQVRTGVIHRHTHRREGFMKYAVEMGSGTMKYIPSFIKIG